MARFNTTIEVLAPAASTIVPFAVYVPPASGTTTVRRLTMGVRAASPTNQGVTIRLQRCTARGTPSATTAPSFINPNSVPPISPGMDTAWSVNPTLAAGAGTMERSFNTQALVDLPWEFVEEFILAAGVGNGLAFLNIGNAFPAAHTLTLDLEAEE